MVSKIVIRITSILLIFQILSVLLLFLYQVFTSHQIQGFELMGAIGTLAVIAVLEFRAEGLKSWAGFAIHGFASWLAIPMLFSLGFLGFVIDMILLPFLVIPAIFSTPSAALLYYERIF